jgi:type IV secretion system protein TrbI
VLSLFQELLPIAFVEQAHKQAGVLTSLFAAASEISQNQNRSLLTYPSPGQLAGSAAGQQASDLGAQITRRNLNVQPTIKIPVGYRFNVRVNRDILFESTYTPTPNSVLR